MAAARVGHAMDQMRIAMEGEQHRPIRREKTVEGRIGEAMGVFARGLQDHQVDELTTRTRIDGQ